jgi:hypothetical protein
MILFRRDRHDKKTVYYRDEEGHVCIPPDPSMVPPGYTPLVVDNIRQAEALGHEVAQEQLEKFKDSGEFTERLEEMAGNPRQQLISAQLTARTNKERDFIREMVKELDKEAAKRENVRSEAHFHFMGT